MDLASPLWNIPFAAAVVALLWYSFYSESEQIQKLTGCFMAGFVVSNLVMHTSLERPFDFFIDVACTTYAFGILRAFPKDSAVSHIFMLFVAIFMWDIYAVAVNLDWLPDQIVNNLLAMAQLIILSFYGRRYGIDIRNIDDFEDIGFTKRVMLYARSR